MNFGNLNYLMINRALYLQKVSLPLSFLCSYQIQNPNQVTPPVTEFLSIKGKVKELEKETP